MKLGIAGTGKIVEDALYAMEPVRETERNEAAEKWARIMEEHEHEAELKCAEDDKLREQLEAERSGQIPGQVSMEELI